MNNNKKIETENFYELLGVSKRADSVAIYEAYKTCMEDSSCDDRQCREMSRAINVLGNENMRRRYDNVLASQPCSRDDEVYGTAAYEEEMATAYIINEYGQFCIRKVPVSLLPRDCCQTVYVIVLDGELKNVVSKELWNKWRDLCEIWRGKKLLKGKLGDLMLDIELISKENSGYVRHRVKRKISQLPLNFAGKADEKGVVYAYSNDGVELEFVNKYRWIHMSKAIEKNMMSNDGGEAVSVHE